MNELSIKNQEKVLNILIELSRNGIDNTICRPVDFESNFTFISVNALIEILKILESKGLIKVIYADYPDNFNIYTLQITPSGLNYTPQKKQESSAKWIDRIIGWLSGFFTVMLFFLLL